MDAGFGNDAAIGRQGRTHTKPTGRPRRALAERLAARAKRVGECLIWQGHVPSSGYPRIKLPGGKLVTVGRAACVVAYGPLPEGYEPDHLCKNRACIEPSHLEPVPQRVNILRSDGPAAINARKEACVNGHPFDDANTRYRRDGARSCRECERKRIRENATYYRNYNRMRRDLVKGVLRG